MTWLSPALELGRADAVLTVFTSDPGSALGAARVSAFVEQHRRFENTSATLVGVACSLWDREGRAAREVVGALEGTDLPLLETRIPLSRRVPSSTLAKRPVVLSAPTSPVALAYADPDVINGHNGIYNEDLHQFIVALIGREVLAKGQTRALSGEGDSAKLP